MSSRKPNKSYTAPIIVRNSLDARTFMSRIWIGAIASKEAELIF
jgi:hypothetical protein